MKTTLGEYYESPRTDILEVKQEGVICTSGEVDATMDGTFEEIIL